MVAQSKTDLVVASVRRLLRVGATANLLNLLQKRSRTSNLQCYHWCLLL